jgi:hypothetical protein
LIANSSSVIFSFSLVFSYLLMFNSRSDCFNFWIRASTSYCSRSTLSLFLLISDFCFDNCYLKLYFSFSQLSRLSFILFLSYYSLFFAAVSAVLCFFSIFSIYSFFLLSSSSSLFLSCLISLISSFSDDRWIWSAFF